MALRIGIDLGNTTSVAAVARGAVIEVIPVAGSRLLPSVVTARSDGLLQVGARDEREAGADSALSISEAKRCLGLGEVWRLSGEQELTPEQVCALLFGRLRLAAEAYLGQPVPEAVVTVPVGFGENQRRSVVRAAEMAGLTVVGLLPDSTAAAIHWGLDQGRRTRVLVCDFGGRTFEAAAVRVEGNRFQVLAVGGTDRLGGGEMDRVLAGHLGERFVSRAAGATQHAVEQAIVWLASRDIPTASLPPEVRRMNAVLLELAAAARSQLCVQESAVVHLPAPAGEALAVTISLRDYYRLVTPLVTELLGIMHGVLAAAGIEPEELGRVILTGGAARDRVFQEAIDSAFKAPTLPEPLEEAGARGAAAVAASHLRETGSGSLEVINITALPLGVAVFSGGKVGPMVTLPATGGGRPLPDGQVQLYEIRSRRDGSNRLELLVLQGVDAAGTEFVPLERYVLPEVPHCPGRPTLLELEYGYDLNGMVRIEARTVGQALPFAARREPWPPGSRGPGGLPAEPVRGRSEAPAAAGGPCQARELTPDLPTDPHGNPLGSEFDLAADGAFRGYRLGILHLAAGEGLDLTPALQALDEKGFELQLWTEAPSPVDLDAALDEICQLWIIPGQQPVLTERHLDLIRRYYESGAGLYVGADAGPRRRDANRLLSRIFGQRLIRAGVDEEVVSLREEAGASGFGPHPVTTGLRRLSTGSNSTTMPWPVAGEPALLPVVSGADGGMLLAASVDDTRRGIVDGACMRLLNCRDTAGTTRLLQNIACWLVNTERFGYCPAGELA